MVLFEFVTFGFGFLLKKNTKIFVKTIFLENNENIYRKAIDKESRGLVECLHHSG